MLALYAVVRVLGVNVRRWRRGQAAALARAIEAERTEGPAADARSAGPTHRRQEPIRSTPAGPRCSPVPLEIDPDISTAPESLHLTVYRLVQEAPTDARKHAPGTPVHVCVEAAHPPAESTWSSTPTNRESSSQAQSPE